MKPLIALRAYALVLGIALTLSTPARAETAPAKPGSATATTKVNVTAAPAKPAPVANEPADQPSPKKDKDGNINPSFKAAHENFLKRGKEPVGILFLGDSITAGWGKAKPVWEEHYAKHQAANFGIGGDRTQHVLWRIANGELDGIKPKVVVLMIGTNNIGYPAEEIIKGDRQNRGGDPQEAPQNQGPPAGHLPARR